MKTALRFIDQTLNSQYTQAIDMIVESKDLTREKSVTNLFKLSKHSTDQSRTENLKGNEKKSHAGVSQMSNDFPVSDFRVKTDNKNPKLNIKIVLAYSSKYLLTFEKYYKKHVETDLKLPEIDNSMLNNCNKYKDDEFIQIAKDYLENELSFSSAITESMKFNRQVYKLYFKKNFNQKINELHFLSPPNYYLLKDSNWKPSGLENSDWKHIHDVRCKCINWMKMSNKYLQ